MQTRLWTFLAIITAFLASLLSAELPRHSPVADESSTKPTESDVTVEQQDDSNVIFHWDELRRSVPEWQDVNFYGDSHYAAYGPPSAAKTKPARPDRRANEPDSIRRKIGVALHLGNCAGCAGKALRKNTDTNTWDWQYMQSQMLPNARNNMRNKCVFYTGLPTSDRIALATGRDPPTFPKDQSGIATRHACDNNLVSIWMLWPGKNEHWGGSGNDPNQFNFYELRDGGWMQPLWGDSADAVARRAHYFRAMSKAMAMSCSGTVYVMAVQLDAMGNYIGIWPDTEYPALRDLHTAGVVTDLIGIYSPKPATQYRMNFVANGPPTRGAQLRKRDAGYLDLETIGNLTEMLSHALEKRDSCTANLEWSDATPYDWFG